MADSRYDDIKYFSDGEFKVPQEIKVFDGTDFVSLGAKDSFSTNKLCAFDGSNMFCATYRRNDVDIPGTVKIGKDKYLKIQRKEGSDYKKCSVDTYNAGYYFKMKVSVTKSTPLYTVFSKNNGDISNYSYVNYIAKVNSSGKVALYVYSRFYGKSISTKKLVNIKEYKTTSYCINKGEEFTIELTRSSTSGSLRIRLLNSSGVEKADITMNDATLWVANPNHHYLGVETTSGTGDTKTYGDAKISYLSFTPISDRGDKFTVNVHSAADKATTMNSTGGYKGRLVTSGTSVSKSKYTEYIKQTIN